MGAMEKGVFPCAFGLPSGARVFCNTNGATRSFGRFIIPNGVESRTPPHPLVGGGEGEGARGELDKVTSKYVKSNAFGTKAKPAFSKQRTFLDRLAPRKHPKKGLV